MLSGGLDSSAITALAFEKFNSAETFSIISKNKSFSEEKFIDILNFKFKFNSNKYDFNIDNLNEVLLNTIKCQQEPFAGFSIVAQNLLFKKISMTDFKVVLSGQGGDEALMGYLKYLRYFTSSKKRKFFMAYKVNFWGIV